MLVSEPIAFPDKEGYAYCNVVLIVDNSKPPLLLPYAYREREDNKLQDWYFMNSLLQPSFHHIDQFEDV